MFSGLIVFAALLGLNDEKHQRTAQDQNGSDRHVEQGHDTSPEREA
jgi:hypothetical protein